MAQLAYPNAFLFDDQIGMIQSHLQDEGPRLVQRSVLHTSLYGRQRWIYLLL